MYTCTNYRTKKALKDALKAGEVVLVFQPGPFGPDVKDGPGYLEGPHYPAPHTWYASCTIKDGAIVPGTLK